MPVGIKDSSWAQAAPFALSGEDPRQGFFFFGQRRAA